MPDRNVGYVRLAAVLSSTMETIFTGSPVAFPLGAAVVAVLGAAVVAVLGAAVVDAAPGAAVVGGADVVFELPQLAIAEDAVGPMGAIVRALADGELYPPEAAELAKLVQGFAQTLTTADIDKRLSILERRLRK